MQPSGIYGIVTVKLAVIRPVYGKDVGNLDQSRELFNRIRSRDKDSFQVLTENYGWKLYSYIRKKEDNREAADQLFSDTLARFHNNVEQYGCEDPIEAMLCLYADELMEKEARQMAPQEMYCDSLASVSTPRQPMAAPQVPPMQQPKPKKKRSAGTFLANFFYMLCILFLVIGILAALWFLMGILVDMNVLPSHWDLGYSWFNENIANWF